MKFTTKQTAGYFPSLSKRIFWSITKEALYKIFLEFCPRRLKICWLSGTAKKKHAQFFQYDAINVYNTRKEMVLAAGSTSISSSCSEALKSFIQDQDTRKSFSAWSNPHSPTVSKWQWCSGKVAAIENWIERCLHRNIPTCRLSNSCPAYHHSSEHGPGWLWWLW